MRHAKKRNKITKTQDQRQAAYIALASALILKEKITTTEAKARKIRPFAEKAISRAKTDTLANRRLLLKSFTPRLVGKLFKEIGPRYKERIGGYTRIIKAGLRKNDAAKMAIIELIK